MEDWITQSDAAELRGISLQAINNWARRQRVRTKELYGKVLVSRSDVLSYSPSENKGGRPPKAKVETGSKASKKKGGKK